MHITSKCQWPLFVAASCQSYFFYLMIEVICKWSISQASRTSYHDAIHYSFHVLRHTPTNGYSILYNYGWPIQDGSAAARCHVYFGWNVLSMAAWQPCYSCYRLVSYCRIPCIAPVVPMYHRLILALHICSERMNLFLQYHQYKIVHFIFAVRAIQAYFSKLDCKKDNCISSKVQSRFWGMFWKESVQNI